MTLSEELSARGFIYQHSADSLAEILDGPPRVVYLGIDPTAEAIHVGHLVPFMLLNHLLRAGHKVYLLVGGATALIGDPGGRDTERPLVEQEVVKANTEALEANIKKLAVDDIQFVNNYEWLSRLSTLEFLRDVGKHFTVNAMIKKDAVSARMASEYGISYTEFSYALLQSYDYWYLHKNYGCDLQIGGSDQWGNLISGVDYIRRTTGDIVYAITMALVTDKATGKKFGKSMGNPIWLDPTKTTPYQLHQFWLHTNDESVIDYLKLFTFLSLEEIGEIQEKHEQAPEQRIAQQQLADTVVEFVYGADEVRRARKISSVLFGGTPVSSLSSDEVAAFRKEAVYISVPKETLLSEALVESGLVSSKRAVRNLLAEGAITVNNNRHTTDVPVSDFGQNLLLIRKGKRHSGVIEIVD